MDTGAEFYPFSWQWDGAMTLMLAYYLPPDSGVGVSPDSDEIDGPVR